MAACNAPLEATPDPTPQPIIIAITPGLQPLREALHRCAVANPKIGLLVNEIPATAFTEVKADLAIRLGAPAEGMPYAAPLAWEQIAVIVHPDNPVKSLDGEILRGLFTGQIRNWEAVGGMDQEVQIWAYLSGDEIRQVFEAGLFEGEPISSLALLAPDPAFMLEAIAADPAAIGYLPGAWMNGEVRALNLSKELSNSLRAPVLALAPAEPEGAGREFLLCLQTGQGQEEIQQRYQAFERRE